MSLKSYFPEQLDQIKAFLISSTEVVRCLRIDPEMKPMLLETFAKLEEDSEFPHVLVACSEAFRDPISYFEALSGVLSRESETVADELPELDVKLPAADTPSVSLKPPARFVRDASRLSEGLPDSVGSLMLLIDPDEVRDQANYRKSIAFLAEEIQSRWLKALVLDARVDPLLEHIEQEHQHIGVQTFYLSPAEIERRVEQDLSSPTALAPAERRQYKGLLAGFAYARQEYHAAQRLQQIWVAEARQEGEPVEVANALYNLGNTLLATGSYRESSEAFCAACDICVDQELHSLAPFVYANLGIALHRQGRLQEAFSSLEVARDMFKAQRQRPGEAYVVDCLAQMHAHDGRHKQAERAWRYALSLYEGITASAFQDLRENGRRDILEKMEQLGAVSASDGQPGAVSEP